MIILIIILIISLIINLILIFKKRIINFIFKKFNYYFTLKESDDVLNKWYKDDNINVVNMKGGNEDWKMKRIR